MKQQIENEIKHGKSKLFFGAFFQVALVSMNVVFISRQMLLPMAITGFGISLIWTYNVTKVVFGSILDKILYALGACSGTVVGFLIAKQLTHLV